MSSVLRCQHCGGLLPPEAVARPVSCSFCAATSVPAPRVVERVVERVRVVPAASGVGNVPCPRCGHAMGESRHEIHVLRGCRACGGVLLEMPAVKQLEARSDPALVAAAQRLVPIALPFHGGRNAALDCPFCKTPLVRKHLGDTGFSVDVCAEHGIFFDRGEVPAFAQYLADKRAHSSD